MNIASIILAAGSSTRMGRPKQLLPWGDTTLLGHALKMAGASAADRMILVLGAREKEILETIGESECEIIINSDWKEGIGSSIRTGISHILSGANTPDAVLLILADQPLLDTAYLNLLIGHFQKRDGDIICTEYPKKLGVPAIFDQKYFPELSRLEGDTGAGKLIANHTEKTFPVKAGEKTTDIDTLGDYLDVLKIKTTTDL